MNKRAQKILFDTYWSSAGWHRGGQETPSEDDYAYAKSKRIMFDPQRFEHADAVERLLNATAKLSRRVVADAFLASLSTRRLDWRSALGSYAVFQHLHRHAAAGALHSCSICGANIQPAPQDLNLLNFQRLKWGGVQHSDVLYAMLDLELFLEQPPPPPTAEDKQILRNIVSSIHDAPAKVSSASLHKEFSTCLKSNKAERDMMIAILGYCGILATQEHPGFSDNFIPAASRSLPHRHFVDMAYPACWWGRDTGLNSLKLQEYFGHAL